jgi:mRNA-degrading endonuclease RelE of RelBE toxin-antitoxin system/Na+-transporting methylmalonyl-CoA/oxaloacetate decarboxylase gamma subunit
MIWIVLYLFGASAVAIAVAIAITVSLWQRKTFWREEKRDIAIGFAFAALWPLILLLLAIGKVKKSMRERRLMREQKKAIEAANRARAELAAKIRAALPTTIGDKDEASLVTASLEDFVEKSVSNYQTRFITDVLNSDVEIEDFEISYSLASEEYYSQRARLKGDDRISYSLGRFVVNDRTPWTVVMTRHFTKSLTKIDGRQKQRLRVAISEICDDPLTVRGNTVKPLTHDFKECWRYRIGDFRLIYIPEKDSRKVTLLAFSSRGQAYA